MKINNIQIHEISEQLQCGFNIYINKETLEIIPIPDMETLISDNEIWKEELNKIESEWNDYAFITKMESREAFKIMEAFIDEIDDDKLKEDLIKILNRKSPFANFKAEIDSSDYRQKWFDFRDLKYEDYVKEQLESEDFQIE